MPRHPCTLCCLLALATAACGRHVAATDASVAATALPGQAEQIEWRGDSACVDCDGIQSDLVLQRDGPPAHYLLTERYLSGDTAVRFRDRGRWRRDRDLLRLDGSDGSARVYALLPDGRLDPRDRHGRPLAADAGVDATLAPVAIGSAQ